MNFDNLKIALIHDWCYVNGGAEKVVKAINEVWPQIDNYTLFDVMNSSDKEYIFGKKKLTPSFIQYFPFLKKKHRYYFPLFKYAIEEFNLDKYDIVLTSSAGFSKNVLTNHNQLHICYCHSPMRYAWDFYHSYTNKRQLKNPILRNVVKLFFHKLRIWDVIGSNRVDFFVVNSKNIRNRLNKIYRRDSYVIYPPVDVEGFSLSKEKQSYYVTASRLVDYKRVDIIVEAFNNLSDKKIYIIGSGPEQKNLEKKAISKNIIFLNHISKDELINKFQKAKAFIFAANEDFGIVPVEAQACGTPVIAYASGGSLETVINKKTGLYFEEQTKESLVSAVIDFEKIKLNQNEIRQNAENFSTKAFKSRFKSFVELKYKEFIEK